MCIKLSDCVSRMNLMICTPGRSTPVCAIGPSSRMRLTRMCPAAFFMVHPIPFSGSLSSVTRFRPVRMCGKMLERGKERFREVEGGGRSRREVGKGLGR